MPKTIIEIEFVIYKSIQVRELAEMIEQPYFGSLNANLNAKWYPLGRAQLHSAALAVSDVWAVSLTQMGVGVGVVGGWKLQSVH